MANARVALRHFVTLAAVLPAISLVACAHKPPPAPAPVPVRVGDLSAKEAAEQIATDFAKQIGTVTLARPMAIDPLRERATGQQTGVSMRLESELAPALVASIKGAALMPFDSAGLAKSRYLVTGTVAAGDGADHYVLTVALTDIKSGLVVAQSAARFVEAGLDATPTRFYNDSPVLMRDRSSDGYRRTSETPVGQMADALYVSQVETSALVTDAENAYNAEKWEPALAGFTAASRRTDGQQLRTFNGLYLSNLRLNRMTGAEDAFGKIATLGLETNTLEVKLLFKPGSSAEYWPGRDYATVYPMWIRQLARAMQRSGRCLNVVGHTSRSGSEGVNDRLSLQRAETVKRLLEAEVRTLAPRLKAIGLGYRENIFGTGTDDARDALDRRVEFKVVECTG